MSKQDSEPPADADDVVVVRGPTQDGEGVEVLRARKGAVETGELRSVRPGSPVQGLEVVRLIAREGSPLIWNVRVEYDGRDCAAQQGQAAVREGHGPAKVSSRAYRDGWDAVFGCCEDSPEDLN